MAEEIEIMKDPFKGFEFPSEKEINEETRRDKISQTHAINMKYNPAYKKLKQDAALKTAEIRRKVPIEDRQAIFDDYWNLDKPHGSQQDFLEKWANFYNVGTGAIERIILNSDTYHIMPNKEYIKIKDAYHKKYPDGRSNSLKKSHANMTADQKAIKNLNISIAQDPVDEQTALAIYNEGRLQRTGKAYKSIAKKYIDKNGKKIPWQKVRDIVNGHHYALEGVDIEADVKEYNKIAYGTYKFVSEHGEVFEFDDKTECGKWMIEMQYGKDSDRNPLTEIALFDKTIPNQPYTCRRRFWKKWTITNFK